VGGGRIVVVDPDNERLAAWYAANGFIPTAGNGLCTFMKMATSRAYLPPS